MKNRKAKLTILLLLTHTNIKHLKLTILRMLRKTASIMQKKKHLHKIIKSDFATIILGM